MIEEHGTMTKLLKAFITGDDAVAAVEFALIFPVLVTIFLASVDLGQALWMNRKVIATSQTVGDLLARSDTVDDALIADVIDAADLIMEPFDFAEVGYDIISIRFDDDDALPEIAWRETVGMPADDRFPELADGLGAEGDGVMAVVVTATFEPVFYGFVLGDIDMTETAFLRGRRQPFVGRD
ncbi:MAG: hypothetical protein Alpg2KO_06260 [Alphaproteobacteria bacterium]